MFTLPPGIQTVCIVQFFSFFGWFPILFFTSNWVSEIYKQSMPSEGIDPDVFASSAVRSGAQALLLNAIVNVVTSVGLPYFVSESGVQVHQGGTYTSLNEAEGYEEPSSALWKRAAEEVQGGGMLQKVKSWAGGVVKSVKDGTAWVLPVKGLTLVRVWWMSQFVFAGTMACTW
jgi:solute carrier family 45 protein 1/2/4